MFCIIDESNMVIDAATRRDNIVKEGIIYEINDDIRYGDVYNPNTKQFTRHPENYPTRIYTEEELNEQKIQRELRSMAIENLKTKGELSQDYTDTKKL